MATPAKERRTAVRAGAAGALLAVVLREQLARYHGQCGALVENLLD